MTRLVLFSAAALLVLASCATMQDVNPFSSSTSKAFSTLDQDGNGMVSKGEAAEEPTLAQAFARLDTNHDNNISPMEYQAATANVARGVDFAQGDLNHDGVISQREADAMPVSLREAFDRVDADGDDNISPVEYQAATTNLLQGLNFQELDADNDGVLSEDEAAKAPLLGDAFDWMDADEDGWISQAEFTAAQR
jgi:Ca2+-binding EF-hand superfamily protein